MRQPFSFVLLFIRTKRAIEKYYRLRRDNENDI